VFRTIVIRVQDPQEFAAEKLQYNNRMVSSLSVHRFGAENELREHASRIRARFEKYYSSVILTQQQAHSDTSRKGTSVVLFCEQFYLTG
jgi:hypothetical protein